jgi:ABC-type branched-subunit amino acid transport system substrate-binding protein
MKTGMRAGHRVGVCLVALLVAACSDDGKADDANGPEQQPAPDLTGEPVKVGQIVPIDVPSASLRDQALGLEAAVDAFNRRGGLDGRPIELVQCDGGNDPNQEADCARQMVDEGVVATLADLAVANPDGVEETLGGAGIARIGVVQASLGEYSSRSVFGFDAGGFGIIAAEFQALLAEGHTKISLVVSDVPAGAGLAPLLGPGIEAAGGTIVNNVPVPPGSADYSQFVAAAEANGATAVVVALSEQDASQLLDAASQLDTDLTIASTATSFSVDTLGELGEIGERLVYVSGLPAPTSSEEFPGLELFLDDMAASDDEELELGQLKANPLRAWLSLHALVAVTEGVDTIDAASVLDAFTNAKDVDMLGLVPPWTPSTRQAGLFENISNPYMLRMSFDGERFVPDPEPFDVAAFMSPG